MARKRPANFDPNQLNQMQWYLGEETIEDYDDGLITRRVMLRRLIAICGGSVAAAALMSACGAPVNAPAAPAAPTTEPPAVPTTEPPAPANTAPPVAAVDPTMPAPPPAATNTAAAAATPAAPTTPGVLSVPADAPGVKGEDVTFQSVVAMSGYLARPSADGTYPGVIVIHENRGLTDHIKDVARRLASAGFVALAPDLVSRSGSTTALTDPAKIAGQLSGAKPEELVADLSAAVAFLITQPGLKSEKVGVVGFCFGGGYTLQLAAANPNISAAVCYYGVTPQPASVMAATNAAVMGQYGGDDARVNGTIPALEEALSGAGKTFEKHIYDGAGHAFNNDTGARYHEKSAVEAWGRTLGWFKKYL